MADIYLQELVADVFKLVSHLEYPSIDVFPQVSFRDMVLSMDFPQQCKNFFII